MILGQRESWTGSLRPWTASSQSTNLYVFAFTCNKRSADNGLQTLPVSVGLDCTPVGHVGRPRHAYAYIHTLEPAS